MSHDTLVSLREAVDHYPPHTRGRRLAWERYYAAESAAIEDAAWQNAEAQRDAVARAARYARVLGTFADRLGGAR